MVDDTVLATEAAALAGFADMGPGRLNCAQVVVRFAAILLGAGEDSVVLARHMGGGMTGMGEVCGALSGTALSLGLRDQLRGLSWADRSSPRRCLGGRLVTHRRRVRVVPADAAQAGPSAAKALAGARPGEGRSARLAACPPAGRLTIDL